MSENSHCVLCGKAARDGHEFGCPLLRSTGAQRIRDDAADGVRTLEFRDGEPCAHRGCLSHVSHPCEGCGRIAGRGNTYRNPLINAQPAEPSDTARRVADLVMDSIPVEVDADMYDEWVPVIARAIDASLTDRDAVLDKAIRIAKDEAQSQRELGRLHPGAKTAHSNGAYVAQLIEKRIRALKEDTP